MLSLSPRVEPRLVGSGRVTHSQTIQDQTTTIVFGVGGAGGSAVAALLRHLPHAMRVVCADTDVQALQTVPAANRLQLGCSLTAGLDAGGRAEIGREAAEEALSEIEAALDGATLCVIAAGLGGGTGSGAAPVIARAARARGILTIGMGIGPFAFEGARRARTALADATRFVASADGMLGLCNQTLLGAATGMTMQATLDVSDSIIAGCASDFAAVLGGQALKPVALADLRGLLGAGGHGTIGYGDACSGADRASAAARSAWNGAVHAGMPSGAGRLLVTVSAGPALALREAEAAICVLRASAAPHAELLWGAIIDPDLGACMRIRIVAVALPTAPPVAARAAAYWLPVATYRPVSRPMPMPASPDPAPVRTTAQLTLAFDPLAEPGDAAIAQRVLAVVPRSAVMPSLADRLYRGVRAVQRRLKPRSNIAPATVPTAPGPFRLVKPFDPPPRARTSARGALTEAVRKDILVA